MRRKQRPVAGVLLCLGTVLLAACVPAPRLVHHPRPQLTVNTDWLSQAGCTPSGSDWECTPTGPLAALGCERVHVTDLFGGLTPPYPLVGCDSYSEQVPDRTRFTQVGCMRPCLTAHLLFKDGAYRLMKGAAELQRVFAPVEAPEEALGYALAATDLCAVYGQEAEPYYRWLVRRVEDTHVDETADGYVVHLFSRMEPLCGCGVHTIRAVDVLVTREGQVTETRSQAIYELDACLD